MQGNATLNRFPHTGYGPTYSKLFQLLSDTTDTVLTDTQLEAACGKNCRVGGDGYGTLTRVIRRLEQHGRVWRRDPGKGQLKLQDDLQRLDTAQSAVGHARRTSRRAGIVVSTVNAGKLSNEDRLRANALLAMANAMALVGSTTTQKRLEARQAESVADVASVIQLLAGQRRQIEAKANNGAIPNLANGF